LLSLEIMRGGAIERCLIRCESARGRIQRCHKSSRGLLSVSFLNRPKFRHASQRTHACPGRFTRHLRDCSEPRRDCSSTVSAVRLPQTRMSPQLTCAEIS
jgi:hypothetical protein